jgi:hypothetical protein
VPRKVSFHRVGQYCFGITLPGSPRSTVQPNNLYRAWRVAGNRFGYATHPEVFQARSPVRAKHDQVGGPSYGVVDNPSSRITFLNIRDDLYSCGSQPFCGPCYQSLSLCYAFRSELLCIARRNALRIDDMYYLNFCSWSLVLRDHRFCSCL